MTENDAESVDDARVIPSDLAVAVDPRRFTLAVTLDATAAARLRRSPPLRAATEERARSEAAVVTLDDGVGVVTMERAQRRLRLDDATVSFCLEQGTLRDQAGAMERPWRRATFSGPLAAAVAAADLIGECRLGTGAVVTLTDPTATARALLAEAPPVTRSTAIHLDPRQSAAEALAQIQETCLAQWLGNLAAVAAGSPQGVHQARVGLRRHRAAIALFRGVAPSPPAALVNGLRALSGAMADARDWDVFLDEIMPPPQRVGGAGADFSGLTSAALQRRAAGRVAAAAAAMGRAGEVALAAWRWIAELQAAPAEGATAGEPIGSVAVALLDKRLRQTRRRGRAYQSLSDDARHAFRIHIKKLRYGVDFFESLLPPKRRRRAQAALEEILDGLGALNDVATARRLLGEVLATEKSGDLAYAAGVIAGWHLDAAERRVASVGRLWRAFEDVKPCWR